MKKTNEERTTMKAMLLTEYKQLEVTDMPEPEIGSRDVLVEVRACGICGSDIHGYDGSSGRRIPPLVMGHEAAGVVAKKGSDVDGFEVGDRVTFDSTVSCGHCKFCRAGNINLCDNRKVLGVSCGEYRQHGAFAQYVAVPQNILYKIPEGLAFEHAAMIEAVSIAVHAANRAPVRLGDTAVIVGSGMIGLLVVQAIRLAGCSQVIAVDLDEDRLKLARELGADVTLNPQSDDVVAQIQSLTGGQGADIAIEVVGASVTIQTAIDATRKGGAITLVGNLAPKVEVPLQAIVTRELTLYGSCASNGEYPACIDLLERGDIKVEPLITAKASLEEGPDYFARLYKGEPGAMKVIIQPNG
ncbi:Sorbitol dehydrogenase [Thalassoglobus polymorphus]|uniref:Sorbitol dehydrogenase n=2 Tax=Thalassoglobus polymorphus TaxID=2527994 RepID=A0A517QMK8_9PLAN|nr:Sorbitol dehydrogenase [Thalassoglobus polymorphus]